MKKNTAILLLVCLLIAALAGCGSKTSKDYNIDRISQDMSASGVFTDIMSAVDGEMAQKLYGYDAADVAQCSVMCSTGATAEEIALFKCADDKAAARVLEKAQGRIASQKSAYESYAPGEIQKLDSAVVKQDGEYVFCVVSTDAKTIEGLIK